MTLSDFDPERPSLSRKWLISLIVSISMIQVGAYNAIEKETENIHNKDNKDFDMDNPFVWLLITGILMMIIVIVFPYIDYISRFGTPDDMTVGMHRGRSKYVKICREYAKSNPDIMRRELKRN